MDKVLLIAKYDNVTTEIKDSLAASCRVKLVSPKQDYISDEIARSPDVIIYVIGAEDYSELAEYFAKKCAQTPLIIIGGEDEEQELSDRGYLKTEWVRFLQRPVDKAAIKRAVDEFLSLVKSMKRADQKKKLEFKRASAAQDVPLKPDGSKYSVLLVDDSPGVLRAMHAILSVKYEVYFATSGQQALDTVKVKRPDIILLDYEMPKMDGKETFERLHADPKTKDIPVIFLTGIAEFAPVFDVVEMRPQGYLLKPCKEDRLFSEIEKALESVSKK